MATGADRPDPASWFLALPVPDEVRRTLEPPLADLSTRHDDLAWTRPEGWHVTVAFLGRPDPDGPDEVLARARAAVADVPVDRDRLAPGEVVVLGRAVAVSVAPVAWLRDLHDRVATSRAGSAAGAFRPHVTLARTRGRRDGVSAGLVARLDALVAAAVPAWDPVALALMASHRRSGPAHYTVESRVALPTG